MDNLKSRDQFLMEKLETSLITEAGIQSNNSKWSETMIGKLFGFVFRVVTLNGYLADKFKDAFGAKSFIIKNLAKRLEKAIDKLPGEYVQRNESIDNQNLEMQFYDELLSLVDMMNKSKDIPVGQIHKTLEKSIGTLNNILLELDPKDETQSKLILEIKTKLKIIENVYGRVKEVTNDLTEAEADAKTGYGLEKTAEKLGDKNELKRKVEGLKSTLRNTISNDKDDAKLSTKSMFEVISILNKARGLYMEEDREGETVFRGNKKETVFKPNRRLFDLWEERVLKILGRKSSIIPKSLLSYINSSLASVDPIKYNFEVSPGVERNVLDQLADVDRAMDKVNKKFNPKNTPRDVIPVGKSSSDTLHLKKHERIAITQESLLRGMISLTAEKGNVFTYNEKRDDTVMDSFQGKTAIFVPTRTYVNGMVLGVMSFSPEVFENAPSTGGAKINLKDLSFENDDFWRKDAHFYWGVLNKKDLAISSNYVMKIFNPGVTVTNDRLTKLDEEGLFESIVFNRLGEVKALYGGDDKIVEIDKNYLAKKFNFNSTGYRSIDNYFNANKF